MTRTPSCRCNRCGARLAADNADGRCASCQAVGRDRVVQPPAVPPEFWMDEGLLEAFRARHMGGVIRAYRCHPYHGHAALPQEIVAGWVGIAQAQLSRIERGVPIVHLDRLIHWAKVLGIPGQHLWFALPDNSPRSESQDVKRRQFLTTSAGLVGGLARPLAPEAPHPPTDLAAAILSGPSVPSDPASIAELTKQVTTAWRLRQHASYDALEHMLPCLLTQAETRACGGADEAEQADGCPASRGSH